MTWKMCDVESRWMSNLVENTCAINVYVGFKRVFRCIFDGNVVVVFFNSIYLLSVKKIRMNNLDCYCLRNTQEMLIIYLGITLRIKLCEDNRIFQMYLEATSREIHYWLWVGKKIFSWFKLCFIHTHTWDSKSWWENLGENNTSNDLQFLG